MKKPPDKKKKQSLEEFSKEVDRLTKYLDGIKTYKVNKCSLKSIVADETITEGIQNAVSRTHRIVTRALHFLKLFIIHQYHNNEGNLPTIDAKFINSCLKVVCELPKAGRKPSESTKGQKDDLEKFYLEHFEPTLTNKERPSYKHLNTVLDYQAISIITDYENNIKNHFKDYLNRWVNVVFDKKDIETKIREDNNASKTTSSCFRIIIISNDNDSSSFDHIPH